MSRVIDDKYTCPGCDQDFIAKNMKICVDCGRLFCRGCVSECGQEHYSSDRVVTVCTEYICYECRDKNNGVCSECKEKK